MTLCLFKKLNQKLKAFLEENFKLTGFAGEFINHLREK